jgi:4-amino-4-deoxy-L-arabinose transferase-like glycosyltransferase
LNEPEGLAAAGKWFLLASFLFFSGSYAWLNGPGNAPDEPSHVAYAKYWARTGGMPVFERSAYWPRYTAVHPPFYYWTLKQIDRFAGGSPVAVQFRAFRLASVVFHACALIAIYGIARRAFGRDSGAALGAMASVALNPMFSFVGGSVNNDTLANLAMTLVILAGLRILQERADWKDVLVLGLATGLGFGSKMSVVGPAAVVWAFAAFRRRLSAGQWLTAGASVLLVAGPVFLRNWILYGDPLAMSALYKVEPQAAGWAGFWPWMVSSYESFWAVTGWMLIRVPAGFYIILWILGALSVVGLAAGISQRKERDRRSVGFLALVAAVVLAQGVFYGVTSMQKQGRYLFVGLGALAPLFFFGLKFWMDKLPRAGRAAGWGSLAVFAFWLQWACLTATVTSSFVIPGVYNAKGV